MQYLLKFLLLLVTVFTILMQPLSAQQYRTIDKDILQPNKDHLLPDTIIYHKVRVDSFGNILPWYSSNYGESFDTIMKLVWKFWNGIALDTNGVKYYMNHQVWRPDHDSRGIGGDQVMMALSSWNLLYNYLGDEAIIKNMKYQADYYLEHSLSAPSCKWPNLPYPYNTNIESGIYDGDMRGNKGVLQPDKAGSFGFELVHLYKKTGDVKYLEAAIKIANTLATLVQPGDGDHSPWPFKIMAQTGEVADLGKNDRFKELRKATYTSNWTSTLGLLSELIALHKGNKMAYQKAFDLTLNWLKKYPAKTNEWGPFFEDIVGFSNTQINAVTYAMYIMEHKEADPDWKQTVKNIFQWVHKELGNKEFEKYGVTVTNEQVVYLVPGNSHSSRQASMEILYWSLTGDSTYTRNAIRQLSWATYMVDNDGKNFYPRDDVWMTDGYGDYIRHYIRAMAAAPQLAPAGSNHLLKTSSIVKNIAYKPDAINYVIFDQSSHEIFRLISKPSKILVNGKILAFTEEENAQGWSWQNLEKGGILTIRQQTGNKVDIQM